MSSELMHGLRRIEDVFHSSLVEFNMCRAELYEEALKNREARLSDSGALIVYTGKHTGRSANDKFIVRDSDTDSIIDWGEINRPFDEDDYFELRDKFFDYIDQFCTT
jgi:phosphoenolpyruvate carboxykinase (ATP)